MINLSKKTQEFKHKIELGTISDINEFVMIASSKSGNVKLISGNGLCVNGKSLLGASTAAKCGSLHCVSDEDMYPEIRKFCVNE